MKTYSGTLAFVVAVLIALGLIPLPMASRPVDSVRYAAYRIKGNETVWGVAGIRHGNVSEIYNNTRWLRDANPSLRFGDAKGRDIIIVHPGDIIAVRAHAVNFRFTPTSVWWPIDESNNLWAIVLVLLIIWLLVRLSQRAYGDLEAEPVLIVPEAAGELPVAEPVNQFQLDGPRTARIRVWIPVAIIRLKSGNFFLISLSRQTDVRLED